MRAAEDGDGCPVDRRRAGRYTVLDVTAVLADTGFRRTALPRVQELVVRAWWTGSFDPLDRQPRFEAIDLRLGIGDIGHSE